MPKLAAVCSFYLYVNAFRSVAGYMPRIITVSVLLVQHSKIC